MIAIFDEDGSGTVDFQEFIKGLSAFSSRGNQEEKLRCTSYIPEFTRNYCAEAVGADGQLPSRFMIWTGMGIFRTESYFLY